MLHWNFLHKIHSSFEFELLIWIQHHLYLQEMCLEALWNCNTNGLWAGSLPFPPKKNLLRPVCLSVLLLAFCSSTFPPEGLLSSAWTVLRLLFLHIGNPSARSLLCSPSKTAPPLPPNSSLTHGNSAKSWGWKLQWVSWQVTFLPLNHTVWERFLTDDWVSTGAKFLGNV